MAEADKCVGCGEIIPEGGWVCQNCLVDANDKLIASAKDSLEKARMSINKALAKLTLVIDQNKHES